MKSFAHDRELPALPLPELADTCKLIPALVDPLLDEDGFAATMAAVEELGRPGGAGEALQTALKAHKAALPGNASWLRALWDDMYLAWRKALPVNMNYFFRFREERWGGDAALPGLVLALAGLCAGIGRQELAPESSRGGYQAMDQLRSCFYSRIPGRSVDALVPVPLSAEPEIAVLCKGYCFALRLADGEGRLVRAKALASAFAAIRVACADLPEAAPVGAVTCAERPKAEALRQELQEERLNRLSLAALERCLFVVCLDGPAGHSDDFNLSLLCGEAENRWFDKSLQIITSEDGLLGANFEHAGCDAAIWLYLLTLADERISAGEEEEGSEAAPPWRCLAFSVGEALEEKLRDQARDFRAVREALRLVCRELPGLSRKQLKACKTSPDAFLQIGFQVAQHSVFERPRSSYEAVALRDFAEGRTECARGCSEQALAFARALEGGESADLAALYRAAEAEHKARLRRCKRGLGAERHIAGLAAMYEMHGKSLGLASPPALFSDPGWLTLKHDALSTSGIGAPFLRFFGFGPVVEDGLGIGYAPSDEATGLAISAWRKGPVSPASFLSAFELATACTGALLLSD